MFRLLLSCVAISTILAAAPGPQTFRTPMVFEPNRGQAPATAKWIARAPGYRLLLTTDGATIVLADRSAEAPKEDLSPRVFQPTHLPLASSKAAVSTVQMKLTGSRPWNEIDGLEPTGGVSNYLIGSDPKRWHLGIPHYANVTARQVYEGVDLVFYGQGDDLEYDFVVAPGADPKQIRLAFDGVDRLRVDKAGDLVLTTAGGFELRHLRPKVYQQIGNERVEVAAGYDLLDRRRATFTLAAYDRRRPLIIDPTVAFNTPLGGTDTDIIVAQAVDGSGNVYVTGTTNSTNYPVTEGYLGNQPGDDAFVTKLSPTGGIVFSTYLGGKDTDNGMGIAVDSTGIYVTGLTSSSDFPKKNPFNQTVRIYDGFITKFNLNGNTLIYSSYLGGSNYDYAYGVAVDAAQAAWVVGVTESKDFPIAGGPSAGQQRKYGGNWDGFMARVAPDGLSVRFSTFVGGPNLDQLRDVAVDRTGSVYATGFAAKGFPVTTGMIPCVADYSAIAVRKKGPGTQLPYSTCLGPGEGTGIVVDAGFNVYLSGDTTGKFPTTPGVFQRNKPTTSPLGRSGFVSKLGPSGKVVYATYLGGNFDTFGGQIAVDGRGDIYVGSATRATKFPGAPPLPINTQNGFLSKLTGQGKNLAYTLIMGEVVSDVTVFQGTSPTPPLYVSGATKASGNYDSFVTKLE